MKNLTHLKVPVVLMQAALLCLLIFFSGCSRRYGCYYFTDGSIEPELHADPNYGECYEAIACE